MSDKQQTVKQDSTKQFPYPSFGRPEQPEEVTPSYVSFACKEPVYITVEVLGVTGGNHLL